MLADVLGIVAHQSVPLANRTVLDLAGGGELEALFDAALRLELGHFCLLDMRHARSALAALLARQTLKHVSVKRAPLKANHRNGKNQRPTCDSCQV